MKSRILFLAIILSATALVGAGCANVSQSPPPSLPPQERVDKPQENIEPPKTITFQYQGELPESERTAKRAVILTNKGEIVIDLYDDTPLTSSNFIYLSKNGFYNGLTFHRFVEGFVIQGGDPDGDGTGGPGYNVPAEIKYKHTRGAVATARRGDAVNPERESSGSQFYIALEDLPQLDGGYTVFGNVVDGMEVVDALRADDKIVSITIEDK